MSNAAGYVLLGSSVVPAVFGWDLSRRGLRDVHEVADEASQVAREAHDTVKEAQSTIAAATGPEAAKVAAQTSEVVNKTDALTNGVGDVSKALDQMTGALAPARVFLAIAVMLMLASFVALDVITLGGS
jgi:hypothetical protein